MLASSCESSGGHRSEPDSTGVAVAEATAPQRKALGYCAHTGTLSLYNHGFAFRPALRSIKGGKPPSGGDKRGKITTMTPAAARRFRDSLLTLWRPQASLFDISLTIPGEVTPEEWDKARRRLFKRWERAGMSVIWRVELQKRKQPHMHCVVWTPDEMTPEDRVHPLYFAWLESLPEENRNHPGAWRHATHVKGPYTDIEQSPRWMAYIAAHASKRKKEQLGWQGKQWGFVNRGKLVERQPMLQVELSEESEKRFKRAISRYHHSKIRAHRAKLRAAGIKTRGRPRRLFFPRGCKATRLMDPSVIGRLVMWSESLS